MVVGKYVILLNVRHIMKSYPFRGSKYADDRLKPIIVIWCVVKGS